MSLESGWLSSGIISGSNPDLNLNLNLDLGPLGPLLPHE
jgi:hypothetical protein